MWLVCSGIAARAAMRASWSGESGFAVSAANSSATPASTAVIDVGRIAPAKPKSKAPADTNARLIMALKAKLDALDKKHDDALREIDEQMNALEQQRLALTTEHDLKRTKLKEKLAAARER